MRNCNDSGNHRRRFSVSFPLRTRNKRAREEEEDIISTLPDAVLIHILSFLPTGDSIKTGVLSKRWAYLWTFVRCLSFDDSSYFKHLDSSNYQFNEDMEEIYSGDFFVAVDRALSLYRSQQVRRFEALFFFMDEYQPYLDRWILIATMGNVQHLRLESVSLNPYNFPHHFYDNSSLVNLELGNWDMCPKRQIRWSSLKCLSIWYGILDCDEDVMSNIFSGCPLLEFLLLVDMSEIHRLDLTGSNLRELVMRDYCMTSSLDDYDNVMPIIAPNLRSLEISGRFKKFQLVNVSSLVDTNFCFDCSIGDSDDELSMMLKGVLEAVSGVKELTLGGWCVQVLSLLELKEIRSPLSKHTSITIKTDLSRYSLPGITSLLKSSLCLGTLVLDIPFSLSGLCLFGKSFWRSYYLHEESYWETANISEPVFLHLKTVGITGFNQRRRVNKLIVSFVRFLLTNSRVLCRVDLQTLSTQGELAQELLSIPRSSPQKLELVKFHSTLTPSHSHSLRQFSPCIGSSLLSPFPWLPLSSNCSISNLPTQIPIQNHTLLLPRPISAYELKRRQRVPQRDTPLLSLPLEDESESSIQLILTKLGSAP